MLYGDVHLFANVLGWGLECAAFARRAGAVRTGGGFRWYSLTASFCFYC